MNSEAAQTTGTSDGGQRAWTLAALVAGLMQLTVGFFTVTAIGLISVPLWAIVGLVSAWIGATAILVRTVRHTPLVAALIPLANGLLLWGVIAAGEAWFGWTG